MKKLLGVVAACLSVVTFTGCDFGTQGGGATSAGYPYQPAVLASYPTAAPAPQVQAVQTVDLRAQVAAALGPVLNQNRQALFEVFHPVGTAHSIALHDVQLGWRNGVATSDENDVVALRARFTIYWEGPLTVNGFSKVEMTYDGESQRWLDSQILATNGMTHEEFESACFDFGFLLGAGLAAGG